MVSQKTFLEYLNVGRDYCRLAKIYSKLGKKRDANLCYRKAKKITEYLFKIRNNVITEKS